MVLRPGCFPAWREGFWVKRLPAHSTPCPQPGQTLDTHLLRVCKDQVLPEQTETFRPNLTHHLPPFPGPGCSPLLKINCSFPATVNHPTRLPATPLPLIQLLSP